MNIESRINSKTGAHYLKFDALQTELRIKLYGTYMFQVVGVFAAYWVHDFLFGLILSRLFTSSVLFSPITR